MELNKGDFIKVIDRYVEFASYGSILEVLDIKYIHLPPKASKSRCTIYVKDNEGKKFWWEYFEPYVRKLTPKEVDKYIDKILKRTEF